MIGVKPNSGMYFRYSLHALHCFIAILKDVSKSIELIVLAIGSHILGDKYNNYSVSLNTDFSSVV